ncbi:hypothetical protein ACRRTK_013628 [Alexandromys fortis]
MGDDIIDGDTRQGQCRLEKKNLVRRVVKITEKEPWKQRLIEVFDNKDRSEDESLVPWERLGSAKVTPRLSPWLSEKPREHQPGHRHGACSEGAWRRRRLQWGPGAGRGFGVDILAGSGQRLSPEGFKSLGPVELEGQALPGVGTDPVQPWDSTASPTVQIPGLLMTSPFPLPLLSAEHLKNSYRKRECGAHYAINLASWVSSKKVWDIITGKPEKTESILNTIPTLWVAFYDCYVVSGTENEDLGFSEADKALSAEFQSVLECDSTIVSPIILRTDPQGFFFYWTDQNKDLKQSGGSMERVPMTDISINVKCRYPSLVIRDFYTEFK